MYFALAFEARFATVDRGGVYTAAEKNPKYQDGAVNPSPNSPVDSYEFSLSGVSIGPTRVVTFSSILPRSDFTSGN